MTTPLKPTVIEQFARSIYEGLAVTELQDHPDVSQEELADALADDIEYLPDLARQCDFFMDRRERRSLSHKAFRERFEQQTTEQGRDDFDAAMESLCQFAESNEMLTLGQTQLLRQIDALVSKAAYAAAHRLILRLHKGVEAGQVGSFQCQNGNTVRCTFYPSEESEHSSPDAESAGDEGTPTAPKTIEFFVDATQQLSGSYLSRRRLPSAQDIYETAPEELRPFLASYRGKLVRAGQRRRSAACTCITVFDQYAIACSMQQDDVRPVKRSSRRPSRRRRRRSGRSTWNRPRFSILPSPSIAIILLLVVALLAVAVQVDTERKAEIAALQSDVAVLKGTIAALPSAALPDDVENVQASVEALEQHVDALPLARIGERITALESSRTVFGERLDRQATALSAFKHLPEVVGTHEKQLAAVEQRLATAATQDALVRSERATLASVAKQMQQCATREDTDALRTSITAFRSQVSAPRSDVEKLRHSLQHFSTKSDLQLLNERDARTHRELATSVQKMQTRLALYEASSVDPETRKLSANVESMEGRLDEFGTRIEALAKKGTVDNTGRTLFRLLSDRVSVVERGHDRLHRQYQTALRSTRRDFANDDSGIYQASYRRRTWEDRDAYSPSVRVYQFEYDADREVYCIPGN